MVKNSKYIESIGRRKTAVARVRMTPSTKSEFVVNGKSLEEYFSVERLRESVKSPLQNTSKQKFLITAKVVGGGIMAQAEAVRHGIARALVSDDENLRVTLKKAGYLKRDPRAVERKKFGLKKARRSPQWSKR